MTQSGHWRTALVFGYRGKRRALPSRIGLYIAVDSPNAYSYVENHRSSWECRFGPTRCDDVTTIKRAVALRDGESCTGKAKGEPKWWVMFWSIVPMERTIPPFRPVYPQEQAFPVGPRNNRL